MKRIWPLFLIAFRLHAAPLDEARTALDNGFPQVALVKIEQQFPAIGSKPSDSEANLLYARALIASGQTMAAAALLEKVCPPSSARDFWLAQALAANGDWSNAFANYSRAAQVAGFEFQRESLLGMARMAKNLSRLEEAADLLAPASSWPASRLKSDAMFELAEIRLAQKNPDAVAPLLETLSIESPAETSRRAFLLARAADLQEKPELVLTRLSDVEPTDPDTAVSAATLRALALRHLSRNAEAETMLEEFIAANPSTPGLEKVFAVLDEIYAASASPSSSELRRWSSDPGTTLRQKLATYYLARFEARQKSPAAALPLLEGLAADPSSNPLAQETLFDLAALRIRLNLNNEALAILPPTGTKPHTDFLRGLALSRKGNHSDASQAFLSAARDADLAESALFNAALCQLFSGAAPNTALEQLETRFPGSARIAAFRMQEAFQQARTGDPKAVPSLEALAKSSEPGVASRAMLALAEWKYQQLDFDGAKAELHRISTESDPSREAALRVFLRDNGDPAGTDEAILAARAFLAAHQNADSEPSVRMKLGELLYRRGDFSDARVELETLARKFPASEYGDPALFLAAKALSRIPSASAPDEAILLFEEVAAGNGPLAAHARLEQASILASQAKPLEANIVLDRILSSNPPIDIQSTALMEKGKNLYSLGDKDPANYRAAIDVWKQVAAERSSDPSWRNQALTRIGTALEKAGDVNAAVATYYDVFNPSNGSPTEFFWFYKAGFAAARILESTEKWPEAIRVYETLAATEGPRSLEAKNRIKQLRLEHFLWEDY
ncbi:MAG: tetratricopeptide repeat protein [bacterium]